MRRKARHKMDKAEMRTAKAHFVAQVQAGRPWREAAAMAGLHISRSTAYRLLQVYRTLGEAGLQDGRHGHPIKLRGEVRSFLQDYCQQAPGTPSSAIRMLLQKRFGVSVSVSQINRVRAAVGLNNHPASRRPGKKPRARKIFPLFNRSGRKALLISCCLLELRKRDCFLV